VKLNFDGSLQNNSAAGGYIIRDWRAVLKLRATYYDNTSIIMAEGRAIRYGIQGAITARYRKLDIKGDNLILLLRCYKEQ